MKRRSPPYVVHPWARLQFDKQITEKGRSSPMKPGSGIGPMPRAGAWIPAASRATKGSLAKWTWLIAAGGGERGPSVDTRIATRRPWAIRPPALNERLMSDLRPPAVPAQLLKTLGGNIASVHGVCGT